MCDVAYTLLVDRLERAVQAERQNLVILMAAGAKGIDLPDVASERERFDKALEAPPSLDGLDVEQIELRRALGV